MSKRIILTLLIFFFCLTQAKSEPLFFETITNISHAPSSFILGISKDSIGYMWFGSEEGLYRYNGYNFELFEKYQGKDKQESCGRIRNIFTDRNEQLWVHTFFDVYLRLDYRTDLFHEVEKSKMPDDALSFFSTNRTRLSLNKIINGNHFYIKGNKLHTNSVATKKETIYSTEPYRRGGMTDDYISSFYIDTEDILWLGTREGTIYKVNPSKQSFQYNGNYRLINNQPINTPVRTIYKFGAEFWISSNNYGVAIYRDGELQKEHPYNRLENRQEQIRCLLDVDSSLWMGGAKGLDIYSPLKNELKTIFQRSDYPAAWGKRSSSLYALKKYQDKILASAYNTLLVINKAGRIVSHLDFKEFIGEHSIIDIELDQQGVIWLCSEGSGLLRVTLNENFSLATSELFTDEEIRSNISYDILALCNGKLLIGNSKGLFCMENEQDGKLNLLQLTDKPAYAIQEDNKGSIWISQKEGIVKIENTLSFFFLPKSGSETWQFAKKSSFFDKAENRMYFGANNGYISFDADQIKANSAQPHLLFKSLSISGKEIELNQAYNGQVILHQKLEYASRVVLNHRNNNFAIQVEPLYFEHDGKMTYFYRLDGNGMENTDWDSAELPKISYNQMKPGEYVFRIKSKTEDGIWSNECTMPIIINQAWYFRTEMILLYFILISLLAFFVVREMHVQQKLKAEIKLERLHAKNMELLHKERVDFFTKISHELRTPLSLIINPLRKLKTNEHVYCEQSYYLNLIDNNVESLNQLVNQILDFRKIEVSKPILALKQVEIIRLLHDELAAFKIGAESRHMKLIFEPNYPELNVLTDEERLRSIVQNILSNATKYTPNNGVVKVTLHYETSVLKLKIIDNGVGITKENLSKIFEPFNNVGTKPFYGNSSGVGLALTKKQLEILGGNIQIDSTPNVGTSVKIDIPMEQIKSAPIPLLEDEETSESSALILLIVEDNDEIRHYLYNEFKMEYQVHCRANGKDGLSCAIDIIPDIIISDIMMPEMNGVEMTTQLKENQETSHIPVVLLTAKTTDEAQIEGLSAGASAYHIKPFNMDVLKMQLKNILLKRQKFLERIANKGRNIHDTIASKDVADVEKEFLLHIMNHIEGNLSNDNYRIETLAEELNFSTRKLTRKIKAITNMTPIAFITKIKMEKAAEMLRNANSNVTEIAYQLGYTEASNFSRAFTKYYGVAPSKYSDELP